MACEAELDGKKCEEMVIEICNSLGMNVLHAPSNSLAWDLLVNNVRVQVKKRTTRKSRPNRVELKTSKRGCSFAYMTHELDAFAMLCDGSWLVFPVSAVALTNGNIPNDIDIRKLLKFKDAWQVLGCGSFEIDRQLYFGF